MDKSRNTADDVLHRTKELLDNLVMVDEPEDYQGPDEFDLVDDEDLVDEATKQQEDLLNGNYSGCGTPCENFKRTEECCHCY